MYGEHLFNYNNLLYNLTLLSIYELLLYMEKKVLFSREKIKYLLQTRCNVKHLILRCLSHPICRKEESDGQQTWFCILPIVIF